MGTLDTYQRTLEGEVQALSATQVAEGQYRLRVDATVSTEERNRLYAAYITGYAPSRYDTLSLYVDDTYTNGTNFTLSLWHLPNAALTDIGDTATKLHDFGQPSAGQTISADVSGDTSTSGSIAIVIDGEHYYNESDELDITFSDVSPPAVTPPDSVNCTVVTDDQIDVTIENSSTDDADIDYYEVEIERDSGAWVSPSGGPSQPSGKGTYTYTPASDTSYGSQVGIDSAFRFRARAVSPDVTTDWTSSGTVYTTPIPPHNPSVSRPDANTFEITWENKTDIPHITKLRVRKDDGSGYGGWVNFRNSNGGNSMTVTTGDVASGGDLEITEDARYQFRLEHEHSYSGFSDPVFADYGNQDNVYFADDLESGGFGNWDTTNLSDVDSGVYGTSGPGGTAMTDLGISGPDSGSYWALLESADTVITQLGDLSGESGVIVKCAMAAGSMDTSSESVGLDWYDGSAWQTLRHFHHEYHRQGWVEVSALVPSSWLSTDNRLRLAGFGGSGDHLGVDRVVVSDILHEYTKPAAPSGLTLETTTENELSYSLTDNMAIQEASRPYADLYLDGGRISKNGSTSGTFGGLTDGEQYEIRTRTSPIQPRHGEVSTFWDSQGASGTAIVILPAPTNLSVDSVTIDSAGVSWTDNHENGDTRVEYKQTDAGSWNTFSTLSRNMEAETISGLLHGEQYDVRVVAQTEHTTTEDQ